MQSVTLIPGGSPQSLVATTRPKGARPDGVRPEESRAEAARLPADSPVRGRRVLVGLLLALIVLGSVLFAHLGCERMRAAAPIGSVDGSGRVVSSYGWSLHPVGFMVRYGDGSTATALWW